MAGTSAASPRTQTLTVALDLPSAQLLADQIATIQDLQFVMECCKRLLTELVTPEDERDPVVPQALWSAALTAYDRCFVVGKRFGLTADDVRSLPLEGQVMKFHTWIVDERNKLARHAADPFELAKVGTVLSAPGLSAPGLSGGQPDGRQPDGRQPDGRQPDGGETPGRQLEGITVLSASHILVDGAGVRQLGALASELAKQTAGKAQEQERTVLGDARRLGLDTLYTLPPLPLRPPGDEAPGPAGA